MTLDIDIRPLMNADRKYVAESDLADGKDRIVMIKDVVEEPVYNPKSNQSDNKIVLYFEPPKQGAPMKPFVLGSKVNMKAIEKATGTTKTKEWVGKKIQLYRATEPRSETGFAARIRDFAPTV